jgi:hypothetical protein
MTVQWVTKTLDGTPHYFATQSVEQLALFHTNGWTDTTAPGGTTDPTYRILTSLDLQAANGVAQLDGSGDVLLTEIPPGGGAGITFTDVEGMWSTEAAVHVNSTTHKLTITFPSGTLDESAVRAIIESAVTQGTGVTITPSGSGATRALTLSADLEYLQDQVNLIFGGTHTGITATYDDATGKITLASTATTALADRSIAAIKIALGAITDAEVDTSKIAVFNVEGAVPLADGTSRDAGTASTHGDVDDLAATILGLVYGLWTAGSIIVANADGTPVALTGTGDWAPAYVGGSWTARDLSLFGGGTPGTGTGTLLKQTLFDPVPANGRKFSAALADAIADTTHPVCKIGFFGDSVTEVQYGTYVDRFRKRLARFNRGSVPFDAVTAPTGAPGWVSGSDVTNPVNSFQFALTTGTSGAGGNNLEVPKGLAIAAYQLASGSVLTLQDVANATASPTFDYAEFHYTAQNNAGTRDLEIRIDGTLVQTIHTVDTGLAAGAFDSGRTYVWTGTLTGHTITVTGAGGSAAVFDGVYLGDQRERVRVYNGGNSGTKYSNYLTATNPGPLQTAKNLNLDLVMSAWGIIDYGDITALGNNMTTWFANVRTALPDVSMGVLIPYATQTRADWANYVTVMKQRAALNGVPWLDMSWAIKTNASTTDPRDLVFTDDTHQNPNFGELYAQELGKFILGDHIDWTRVANFILQSRQAATFTSFASGVINGAGLTVESPPVDAGTAKLLLKHDKGVAGSGLVGEIGFTARGATGMLGASGFNPIAAIRARTQGTLSDTSAPLDLEIWNAAASSTTMAKRATWLAGGGLALWETAEPATPTDGVVQWVRDNSGVSEWCFKGPDGVVHVASTNITSGTVDSRSAQVLIAPAGDDTDGILIKGQSSTWGATGYAAGGGSADYGKGQVLAYHRYDATSTDPNDLLLFRLDNHGGMGLTGGVHNAYGLRQVAGWTPGTQAEWMQLYVNAHGQVISNPTVAQSATWDKSWLICTDVRGGSSVNVFEVGASGVFSRHTGGMTVSGGALVAVGGTGTIPNVTTFFVQPPASSGYGMIVRGQAAHTAPLIEVQHSDTTPVFDVDPDGLVSAPNLAVPSKTRYKLFDHFEAAGTQTTTLGNIGGSAAYAVLSGTGAGTSQNGLTTNARGSCACSTGTTTTGYCAASFLNSYLVFTAATSDIWFGARVQIPILSTSGEQFAVRVGIFPTFASGAPTEGLYFRVNHGDTVWHAVSVRATVESDTASSVTVTAGQWYNLRIRYAPNGNWTFYIDGVSVASGSTNKPTDATAVFANAGIAKAAGTTARFVYIDAMRVGFDSDIDIENMLPLAV